MIVEAVFWVAFLIVAYYDLQRDENVRGKHGVPIWAIIAFSVISGVTAAYLGWVSLGMWMYGMIFGTLLAYIGAVAPVDAIIVASTAVGALTFSSSISQAVTFAALAPPLLTIILSKTCRTYKVKGENTPVGPFALLVSGILGTLGVLL